MITAIMFFLIFSIILLLGLTIGVRLRRLLEKRLEKHFLCVMPEIAVNFFNCVFVTGWLIFALYVTVLLTPVFIKG